VQGIGQGRAPGALHQPAPAGVEVRIGIGVLDGQRRLAQTAEALYRGEQAVLADPGALVQALHLLLAADEVAVVAR